MTPITGDGDPPSPTKSSLTQRFFSSIGNKIKGFFMRRKPGFMGTISMYLVEKLFAFTRKLTQHSVPSSKPQEVCSCFINIRLWPANLYRSSKILKPRKTSRKMWISWSNRAISVAMPANSTTRISAKWRRKLSN